MPTGDWQGKKKEDDGYFRILPDNILKEEILHTTLHPTAPPSHAPKPPIKETAIFYSDRRWQTWTRNLGKKLNIICQVNQTNI